jgi:hypothetical protein
MQMNNTNELLNSRRIYNLDQEVKYWDMYLREDVKFINNSIRNDRIMLKNNKLKIFDVKYSMFLMKFSTDYQGLITSSHLHDVLVLSNDKNMYEALYDINNKGLDTRYDVNLEGYIKILEDLEAFLISL